MSQENIYFRMDIKYKYLKISNRTFVYNPSIRTLDSKVYDSLHRKRLVNLQSFYSTTYKLIFSNLSPTWLHCTDTMTNRFIIQDYYQISLFKDFRTLSKLKGHFFNFSRMLKLKENLSFPLFSRVLDTLYNYFSRKDLRWFGWIQEYQQQ